MNPTIHQLIHGTTWDGTPRIEHWMRDCLGAMDSPALRIMSQLFIKGMVARALQPGCEFPYLLVLRAPQGARKSLALRALAGDHVAQLDISPDQRDDGSAYLHASRQIRDVWLAEITELYCATGPQATELKAFITQSVDTYRTADARRSMVRNPRSCVIVATTSGDFLPNLDGNRRFWLVDVGQVDDQRITQVRGHLFAEAAHRLRHGESPLPTRAEQALLLGEPLPV